MNEKLFATGEINPMAVEHRPEAVVEAQQGSADAFIGTAAPRRTSLYLTGGVSLPPEEAVRPVFTEPKSERIRREYPIDVFAAQHLGTGRTRGQLTLYSCPWHKESSERNPHLEVYGPGHKKHGYCKCYRCGNGGSVIDLAMQVFSVDKPGEAMNLIEGKSAFDQEKRDAYAARARHYAEIASRRPVLNPPEHVLQLSLWAADRLATDQAAASYLAQRGLGGAIKLFHLGSTSDMPDSVLPQAWDGEKGQVYSMRSFREAPLIAGGKCPRIVIPYLHPDRDATYVNARAMGVVENRNKYRKPEGPAPEPYLLDWALGAEGDLIMLEGEFDTLSMALALKADPYGTFGVPGLHCFDEASAAKLAGRRVFVITDNDDAGKSGRESLSEMIGGYAREVCHVEIEDGFNDVNDMLVKRGRAYLRGWFNSAAQRAVKPKKRFV